MSQHSTTVPGTEYVVVRFTDGAGRGSINVVVETLLQVPTVSAVMLVMPGEGIFTTPGIGPETPHAVIASSHPRELADVLAQSFHPSRFPCIAIVRRWVGQAGA